ncbi:MAG: sigma-54 interaction domain-containing protein, partial [Aquificaceae bacterium]
LLYTKDYDLYLDGIESLDELPENIERSVVMLDVDTVGLSSLPDLKEGGNILIALTSNRLPGYTMKLMSLGFYDVFLKPVDVEELKRSIKKAKEELILEEEVIPILYTKEKLTGELCKELCSIIGNPEGKMKNVLKSIGRAASLDVPVLITGETGVGKELFAKALWKLSRRYNGPFVAINCSTIPPELLEAELFGYEKGAFTGAISSKEGLIESTKGGILFLDEIGDLPLYMQPKLLRVLQEKKIRRLGGIKEIHCDFRLISATNKDIRGSVREGKFREDLYYRISTIHIHIPPLRERKEDIPILLNCMIENLSKEMGKRIKGYTREFLDKMLSYNWPGNIREMENVLKRAIALSSEDRLKGKDVDLTMLEGSGKGLEDIEALVRQEVKRLIEEGEEEIYRKLFKKLSLAIVQEAYTLLGKNQSKSAKVLGINRITLRRMLEGLVYPPKA